MPLLRYAIIHTEESLDWLTENTDKHFIGPYSLKNFGNLKLHFHTNNIKIITDFKIPEKDRTYTVCIEGEDPETLDKTEFVEKYCRPYCLMFNEDRTFVWGTKLMLKEFMEAFSMRFPEVEFEKANDWYMINADENRAEKRYFEIMEKKSKDK